MAVLNNGAKLGVSKLSRHYVVIVSGEDNHTMNTEVAKTSL